MDTFRIAIRRITFGETGTVFHTCFQGLTARMTVFTLINRMALTGINIVFSSQIRLHRCINLHKSCQHVPKLAPCRAVVDRPDIEADIRYRRYKAHRRLMSSMICHTYFHMMRKPSDHFFICMAFSHSY